MIMNGMSVVRIINKYKKCPKCGSSYKDTKLKTELKDEVITISCECGFIKKVNENNEEISA